MNTCHIAIAYTAFSALLLSNGCTLSTDAPPVSRNQPTREAQQKLVEGLSPVEPKVRLRRSLGAPRSAESAGLPIPQDTDFRNTPAGQAWAAEREKIRQNIAGSDWPKEPAPGMERVIFVDGRKEWELEFDRTALAALAVKAVERGVNTASARGSAGQPMLPSLKPLGWSHGIDNRVVKPINATYPIDHRILMRTGELNNGGCSGHMVGRRLVLTAAHCLIPMDGSILTHTYRARRSGANEPYGAVSTDAYWWASAWTENDCHLDRRHDPCSQHDWALLLLPDDAWDSSPNGTPGWMGYWIYDQSTIENNFVSHNDGYPGCAFPGAPAGCSANPNQAWGQPDAFESTARGFEFPHEGIPAYYRTQVDVSGGHSGSANWTDYPGSEGPYSIGIAIRESCFGADCGTVEPDFNTHPNGYRGMTPFLASFLNDQRVTFP